MEIESVYGFGFLIEDASKVTHLIEKYNHEEIKDTEDLLYALENIPTLLDIPLGFKFQHCKWHEECLIIISPSEESYEEKLMRGEISPIDFTPILEWAKNNNVELYHNIPTLHVYGYAY